MTKFPAVLFPHTHVKEDDLKRIRFLFPDFTICQAWFMETPEAVKRLNDSSMVKILFPDEDLKPQIDLKKLLRQYETWISQINGKNYADSLKAAKYISRAEEHSWEIREKLRRLEEEQADIPENPALGFHILLHLARNLEERRSDTEELLKLAKQQKPPLEGVLEEQALPNAFFDDLKYSEYYSDLEEYQIINIINSWIGLFGDFLADFKLLLTLDTGVINSVKEAFEEGAPEIMNRDCFSPLTVTIPDIAGIGTDPSFDDLKGFPSDSALNDFENLIALTSGNINGDESEITRHLNSLQDSFPSGVSRESLCASILYLPEIKKKRKKEKGIDLTALGGKTIILLQKK